MDQGAYLFDPTRSGAHLDAVCFSHAFGATVARHAERVAIVDGDQRVTWAQLGARVRSLAIELAERGVVRGDVVGLSAPNGVRFVEAHLAIARLGAVTLMLHPAYTDAEKRSFLERTDAWGAIDESAVHVRRGPSIPRLRSGQAARDDTGDPFVLAPTSGTESASPKICMHSHAGLLSNAAQVARDAGIGAGDVFLPASGFSHLFGLLGVHVAMLSGATLVATGKFDARRCIDACARERVTVLWGVPAQFADIVSSRAGAEGAVVEGQLREVRTAGAPLAPALAARIAATFGVAPREHWGMTEIGAGIVDGIPLSGADVRIEDGELLYRRADMFRGYYDDPEQTARALTQDGFLRTGDLFARDKNGRVTYEGRAKDIINRGGMKVSALELESELAALPSIRQAAVVPVPDPRLGERAALVCSLAKGAKLSLEDVRAHLDGHGVAKYKWPEYVIVVETLPTTPTGKIAKAAVRSLAAKSIA